MFAKSQFQKRTVAMKPKYMSQSQIVHPELNWESSAPEVQTKSERERGLIYPMQVTAFKFPLDLFFCMFDSHNFLMSTTE